MNLLKAISKWDKVSLRHWDDSHIITEYHGKGAGGGTHLLVWVKCKYSHYDRWEPTLEELESQQWERYDDNKCN